MPEEPVSYRQWEHSRKGFLRRNPSIYPPGPDRRKVPGKCLPKARDSFQTKPGAEQDQQYFFEGEPYECCK
jgi:hypothetical protein